MPVFRVKKVKDYTIMPNTHLRNRQLSLRAKGLLREMEYIVYASPKLNDSHSNNPITENPAPDNPALEFPTQGKPTQ